MQGKRKNLTTGEIETFEEEPSPEFLAGMAREQSLNTKIRDEEKDTPIMRAFGQTIKKNFKKYKRGNLNGILTLNEVFAQMLVDYPELGGE